MNTQSAQFWLLLLFGLLVIATAIAGWLRWRGDRRAAASRDRVDGQLVYFVEPRLMELRRKAAPLYGDRKLAVRGGGAPDKIETPAGAYDRWQVSDVCDYRKLPGYHSYETVNEPSKHDVGIRERIDELRARRRKGA